METLVGALLCATGPFGHMVLGDSCHGVGVRSCAGGLLKLACAVVLSPVGPGPLLDFWKRLTTFNDGCLGLCIEEGRSEVR